MNLRTVNTLVFPAGFGKIPLIAGYQVVCAGCIGTLQEFVEAGWVARRILLLTKLCSACVFRLAGGVGSLTKFQSDNRASLMRFVVKSFL